MILSCHDSVSRFSLFPHLKSVFICVHPWLSRFWSRCSALHCFGPFKLEAWSFSGCWRLVLGIWSLMFGVFPSLAQTSAPPASVPPPPPQDPLFMLMISQPKIDNDSPVFATASFDPPIV